MKNRTAGLPPRAVPGGKWARGSLTGEARTDRPERSGVQKHVLAVALTMYAFSLLSLFDRYRPGRGSPPSPFEGSERTARAG